MNIHFRAEDPVQILLALFGATRAPTDFPEELRLPVHSLFRTLRGFDPLTVFDF